MKPSELLMVVQSLDEGGPIHKKLEADLGGGAEHSNTWYSSQKEHLTGWLQEYNGPGCYGRANWRGRTAKFIYNHFQCAPGLVWLAEAVGIPEETLLRGCEEVKKAGKRAASQCGAFRKVVPWEMVEERINS